MTSDEITHHRIWHSSSATIVAKTLALALLPVFDLVRPHDLTHYHEDGFPKVVGRPCGYSSLAHFVSDLIAIEVHEEWQSVLGRRYLELWYNDPTDPDRAGSPPPLLLRRCVHQTYLEPSQSAHRSHQS